MDIGYKWSQWWRHYWNISWKITTKSNQQQLRIEKVIKKKGDKLYAKCKGYDNLFTNCIDKKDLIEWNSIVSKWVNTFLNHMNHLVEILMLQLIFLIMQQKQIAKPFHMLIPHVFH